MGTEIQLGLHLWGDYILQSHWMAVNKTKAWWPAFIHATIYSSLFITIGSWSAVFVIWFTHLFIDRFRLARYVAFVKNYMGDFDQTWAECRETGYPSTVPAWLAVWLLIITDNILHLTINFLALEFL